jgi:hypothetical protein
LPNQSNSGPTWSCEPAMNPSTDTTLCSTTVPSGLPGAIRVSRDLVVVGCPRGGRCRRHDRVRLCALVGPRGVGELVAGQELRRRCGDRRQVAHHHRRGERHVLRNPVHRQVQTPRLVAREFHVDGLRQARRHAGKGVGASRQRDGQFDGEIAREFVVGRDVGAALDARDGPAVTGVAVRRGVAVVDRQLPGEV